MATLTKAECKSLQRRQANAYGDKWPYKGHYSYSHTTHSPPLPDLPEGWQWVCIPTWGMHVRKDDDLDYKKDL